MAPALGGGIWFEGRGPTWNGGTAQTLARTSASGVMERQNVVDAAPPWVRLAAGVDGTTWRLAPTPGGRSATASVLPTIGSSRTEIAVGLAAKVPSASLAVDGRGRLWIGDGAHGRLLRVDAGGAAHPIALGYRRPAGRRSGALLLAATSDGRVWVADGSVLSARSASRVERRVRLPFAPRAISRGPEGSRSVWAVGRSGQR